MPRILLAVDGSAHDVSSTDALRRLFGGQSDVHVTILTIAHLRLPSAESFRLGFVPRIPSMEEMERWEVQIRREAEGIVKGAREDLEALGFTVSTRVEWGPPAEMILQAAEEADYDLIAMGRRGAGQVSGIVMGSVSDRVMKRAKAPVLVIHGKDE